MPSGHSTDPARTAKRRAETWAKKRAETNAIDLSEFKDPTKRHYLKKNINTGKTTQVTRTQRGTGRKVTMNVDDRDNQIKALLDQIEVQSLIIERLEGKVVQMQYHVFTLIGVLEKMNNA